MKNDIELRQELFSITNETFAQQALDTFAWQYEHNAVYKEFANSLKKNPDNVQTITDIPFLPVSFFKTHKILAGNWQPQQIFESSGTTATGNSQHFVKDLSLYEESFTKAFDIFYKDPASWCILALLPSYQENEHSSLIYMVENLIKLSNDKDSGFYKPRDTSLAEVLTRKDSEKKKTLLLGVTYALLDFFEANKLALKHVVIMETGGMKGRRTEMIRSEVHNIITASTGLPMIHAEYGMTEMLSQAYSYGQGNFASPPWLRILIRAQDDPMEVYDYQSMKKFNFRGLVNIIDLANIYSCSFIATDDIGKLYLDGRFEILGRSDNSDIRGCSQLMA